jgi:hypothetical protein
MKKLFLALTMFIVLLSTSAVATEEKAEEPVKYEVTIAVTYNAVTADEAAKIQRAALMTHKDACSVEVKSTKAVSGFFFTIGSTTITSNSE